MPDTFGISAQSLAQLKTILSTYSQVQQAILYGSRARGDYRSGSDIDLTLKGKIDYQTLCRIRGDLDDSWIPYTVDLSCYEQLDNTALVTAIDREGMVLFDFSA